MRLQRRLDAGDALRVTQQVLRHAARPAGDPGQRGGGGDAEPGRHFLPRQRDEVVVAAGERIVLAGAADEDAEQLLAGGRPVLPICGRTRCRRESGPPSPRGMT